MVYHTEKYIDLIKSRLSDYRFYHSMCVADAAKKLAKRFGSDEEKAYVAGILHDITKEADREEHFSLLERAGMKLSPLEKENKKLYHQMSGAAFIRLELGITDPDIIRAVRYHTTGRRGMSLPEQIIYLADLISEDRTYDDVDMMRKKTEQGREEGMLYAMRYTIIDNVNKGSLIHPDTIDAYNWVIEGFRKQRKANTDGNT